MKTAGREAGKYCTIVKKIDENFVMVTGPKEVTGIRKRKCNIEHLEPTEIMIKIKADETDASISKEYEKEGVFSKLKFQKRERVKEKTEKPKEEKKEVKKDSKKETAKEKKPKAKKE